MQTGGTEKIIYDLCKGLSRKGWNIFLISSGGRLVKEIESLGVKHFQTSSLSSKSPISILKSSIILKKVIEENNINIVNSHSFAAALATAIPLITIKKKLTHIFTLHIPERNFYFKVMGITLNWLVDKVFTVCKWNEEKLINSGVNQNKIKVIYNGINIEKFNSNNKKLSTTSFIKIGVVARLVKRKGHSVLLQAVSHFLKNYKDVDIEVHFFGEGPNLRALEKLAYYLKLQNIVKFHGDTTDITLAYKNIDIFVLPSFSEGLPLTILEAMSSRVPVITTNVNGIPEIVKNGITGLIFFPGDHEALSQNIRKIVENPSLKHKLTSNAYSWVSKNLSIDKMVTKYEKNFLNLLK